MAGASEMYHRGIQALAHEATGEGRLEHPTGSAFLDNPLCGDNVEMQVALAEDRLVAVGHKVRGCLLCKAAASLIGRSALGASVPQIDAVVRNVGEFLRSEGAVPAGWQDLALFTPVRGHASRYSCVELPFRALVAALTQAGSRNAP